MYCLSETKSHTSEWIIHRKSPRRKIQETLQIFSQSAFFGKYLFFKIRMFLLIYTFVRWMNSLLGEGYKKELEMEDIFEVRKQDESEVLGDRLEQ